LLQASATIYPVYAERLPLRRSLRRLFRQPRSRAYRVTINLEQAPDRNNRVTLSSRKDRFDQPLPRLDWRWNPIDESSRGGVRALIRESLESAGFGRVVSTEQARPDPNAHHHAGTTRMSRDPADGVVDQSCRLHGMENLYLAGASVFPTAGFANPTLTILALALRLADHLSRTEGRPSV
jgi:choline dehydrogenase-like flavoprotein